MGKNMSSDKTQNQELSEFIIWAFLGTLLLAISPLLIVAFIFSYFIYISYNFYEDRKIIRSLTFFLSGGLMSYGLWQTLLIVSSTFISNKFLKDSFVQQAYLGYPAFVAGGLFLCSKFELGPGFYDFLQRNREKWFIPIRFTQYLNKIVLFVIFSLLRTDLSSDKRRVKFVRVLILIIMSLSFVVMFERFYEKTAFKSAITAILVGYVLLYVFDGFFEIVEYYSTENTSHLVKADSKGGFELGRVLDNKKLSLKISWKDINHHIHILGQPGSGKTVLLKNFYSNLISSGYGMIMLDLKADIDVKEEFKALCTYSNRTKDLMIVDLSNPESSYGYNPLLLGNATEIKDKLVGAIEWSEPYYKKVSERFLLIVLKGFVWLRDNKGLISNLEDLVETISVSGLSLLVEKIQDVEIKADINALISNFNKETARDLEGLKTDLTLLTKSEFSSILKKKNAINIYEVIRQNKVLLVNLDGQTYNESSKRFGRLLLSDLRSASGTIVTKISANERPKCTVIIDEFADIISTEDMARTFVGFLNRCRGSGIGVIVAHQSLGDFKDPTTRSQIVDSTETTFSFIQKDPETCETLAAIVGTHEVWEKTEQTKDSLIFSDAATGLGSRKRVQEYLYHPNEFKNLPTGVCVYIAKKPSRYAKVKVNFLEIKHLDPDQSIGFFQVDTKDVGGLNLKAEILARSAVLKDGFKRKENTATPTLEI